MNILIGGLTGAGKTTLCKLLSKDLKLAFISGSETRLQFISGKVPTEARKYWLFSEEAEELDCFRLNNSQIDIAMDGYLRDLVLTKSKQIFDVWFLPWLVSEKSLKIWLECSLEVRAQRIYESLGLETTDYKLVYQKTFEKDMRARQFANKTYGVDIFTDRSPFDVIISSEGKGGINLTYNALKIIAENYFEHSKSEHIIPSILQDEFTSIIYRCPAHLSPQLNSQE